MLACGPAFFFSAFLWSFSLPLPLGGGAGFWVLFFLGLSGLPCSFTAGSHWPNRAGLGLRWCPFPYPVPKTAHRAEFGFHRFFLVRFWLGRAAKPSDRMHSCIRFSIPVLGSPILYFRHRKF